MDTANNVRVRVTYTNLSVSASEPKTGYRAWLPWVPRRKISVLEGVSGTLEPGTMTLVIGPRDRVRGRCYCGDSRAPLPTCPAAFAGKTALLRAITGRHPAGGAIDPSHRQTFWGAARDAAQTAIHAVTGFGLPKPADDWREHVFYAGHTASRLARELGVTTARLAAISPQDDRARGAPHGGRDAHVCALAVRAAAGGGRPESEREAWGKRVTDVIASLGLSECADTIIGSPDLRGISGASASASRSRSPSSWGPRAGL